MNNTITSLVSLHWLNSLIKYKKYLKDLNTKVFKSSIYKSNVIWENMVYQDVQLFSKIITEIHIIELGMPMFITSFIADTLLAIELITQ